MTTSLALQNVKKTGDYETQSKINNVMGRKDNSKEVAQEQLLEKSFKLNNCADAAKQDNISKEEFLLRDEQCNELQAAYDAEMENYENLYADK